VVSIQAAETCIVGDPFGGDKECHNIAMVATGVVTALVGSGGLIASSYRLRYKKKERRRLQREILTLRHETPQG
jgi:hypothetical protein